MLEGGTLPTVLEAVPKKRVPPYPADFSSEAPKPSKHLLPRLQDDRLGSKSIRSRYNPHLRAASQLMVCFLTLGLTLPFSLTCFFFCSYDETALCSQSFLGSRITRSSSFLPLARGRKWQMSSEGAVPKSDLSCNYLWKLYTRVLPFSLTCFVSVGYDAPPFIHTIS